MTLPGLLLVEPPFYRLYSENYGLCRYPLGVGSLAAAIAESGRSRVRILNCDFHPDPAPFSVDYLTGEGFRSWRNNLDHPDHPAYADLKRLVGSFRPDVAGISVRTPLLAPALTCARIVKNIAPGTLVVFGGPHATVTGGAILQQHEVDLVLRGEGETAILALMDAVASGRNFDGLNGVSFRRNGTIISTQPGPVIADLDRLPPVHRFAPQVLEGYDRYPPSAFGHVFTARGCPFGCAFCSSGSIWPAPVRFRSEEGILAELAGLRSLGLDHVHFDDDTFGVTHQRLLSLCRSLERARLGLTYSCETHVSLVSEATVQAMVRAGFNRVQLGLESGDDAMLRRIGKNFTAKRALEAADLIKRGGLRLELFIMAGFPDETEDSLAATRRLVETVEADKLIYSIFTPYPGTPLFERCRESGLIGQEHDFSRHNHQSPENAFCPGLGRERFRRLSGEIEALVAARNRAARERPEGCNMRIP